VKPVTEGSSRVGTSAQRLRAWFEQASAGPFVYRAEGGSLGAQFTPWTQPENLKHLGQDDRHACTATQIAIPQTGSRSCPPGCATTPSNGLTAPSLRFPSTSRRAPTSPTRATEHPSSTTDTGMLRRISTSTTRMPPHPGFRLPLPTWCAHSRRRSGTRGVESEQPSSCW
jgi:hypothetical protein